MAGETLEQMIADAVAQAMQDRETERDADADAEKMREIADEAVEDVTERVEHLEGEYEALNGELDALRCELKAEREFSRRLAVMLAGTVAAAIEETRQRKAGEREMRLQLGRAMMRLRRLEEWRGDLGMNW